MYILSMSKNALSMLMYIRANIASTCNIVENLKNNKLIRQKAIEFISQK